MHWAEEVVQRIKSGKEQTESDQPVNESDHRYQMCSAQEGDDKMLELFAALRRECNKAVTFLNDGLRNGNRLEFSAVPSSGFRIRKPEFPSAVVEATLNKSSRKILLDVSECASKGDLSHRRADSLEFANENGMVDKRGVHLSIEEAARHIMRPIIESLR